MMLATLGQVGDSMGVTDEGRKARRVVLVSAAAGLGNWRGAEVIPFILPTCNRAAMKLSFAHSPAAGTVDWCAHLRIVLVGGAGWPCMEVKRRRMGMEENWREGVWARNRAI